MERYPLEELIELAARAADADAPASPAPWRSDCLPMTRLERIARGSAAVAPVESAHLSVCPVCAARSRAFGIRAQRTATHAPARRLWQSRFARGVAVAAAAALAFLLIQPRPSAPHRPKLATGVTVNVRYAPQSGALSESRVDCFQSTSHEPCVMLALFRTWNSACQCLMWELHEWEDGATLAEITPGESVDVPLNVSGSPPIQQLFVVAAARERHSLPQVPADNEVLLECLNHSAPPLGTGDDTATYTSAVSACLPTGVTVVPAAFVPR